MKVLVTGAKGQVGSELVLEGKKRGLDILAVGREQLDITQQDAVNKFFQSHKPDVVINASAYTAVDKAESEPELAHAINCVGATNLARACADKDIPLLHISTDYVFDGNKVGAYTEADIPNPQCIYGKSKLAGERAIESILEVYIILRVAWVFGDSGNNFVKTMLRLGKERDELNVVADQHGSPTWAGAIASTLLDIADRWRDGGTLHWGTFHYSGRPTTTWHGFAEAIFEEAKKLGMISKGPLVKPITTAEYPTPAQRPLNSVLDCQKITKELDVVKHDWLTGLNRVLESWKGQ